MAKIPPYNAGGEGSVPGQGTESPHAHDQKNNNNKETWNRSNTVTNSIKTWKLAHIRTFFKKTK